MNFILPQIGTTGIFSLKAPLDTLIQTGVSYTVSAIRRIGDIISNGEDPYVLYYASKQIAVDIYNDDVKNNVCILSLQATDGTWIYIPNSFLLSMPTVGGVPYTNLILAADLGPIPQHLDMFFLSSKVGDVIRDVIGIQTEVKMVVSSAVTVIPTEDSKVLEAARQHLVQTSTTDYARYLEANAKYQSALQKIALLEEYIRTHPTP